MGSDPWHTRLGRCSLSSEALGPPYSWNWAELWKIRLTAVVNYLTCPHSVTFHPCVTHADGLESPLLPCRIHGWFSWQFATGSNRSNSACTADIALFPRLPHGAFSGSGEFSLNFLFLPMNIPAATIHLVIDEGPFCNLIEKLYHLSISSDPWNVQARQPGGRQVELWSGCHELLLGYRKAFQGYHG